MLYSHACPKLDALEHCNQLWILSRTPQLPLPAKEQLISHAQALGFATDELIFSQQQVAH
jgi:lipocalin